MTKFGPFGTEFTATMGTLPEMPVGYVLPTEDGCSLMVLAHDGRTAVGKALWYRFRVIQEVA